MKTLPQTGHLAREDINPVQAPLKVCMHLANTARDDFRVMRDARTLAEAGFSVTVIDIEEDHSLPREEEFDGIRVKHTFVPGWFTPARFKPWFLIKLIIMFMCCVMRLLKDDADIYHAHVEKALPASFVAARLRRKPLIFDAPDLTLSDPSLVRWQRLRKLSIRFLGLMISRCTAFVTASPHYAPVLRSLYHASRITVIRNVPSYRTVNRNDLLRQHLGLSSDIHIALYQGNIQANRGLDRVVRAAKFLKPGIVVVLMGFARESARSQLEALIASEQVADRVKILPPVPYEQLLDWTASADIGLTIFPPDYSLSIKFTLPNKLFEYMMAGLPILSAKLDAIAELLEAYDVGRVAASLTPEDLSAAINAMFADTAALARMRENALEAARQEFHWEREGQKLVQLYQSILTKSLPSEVSTNSGE